MKLILVIRLLTVMRRLLSFSVDIFSSVVANKCRVTRYRHEPSYHVLTVFLYPTVVPTKHKPYSPFQNLNNKAEYAVARLDDLLNWGRKVGAYLARQTSSREHSESGTKHASFLVSYSIR